MPAAPLPSNESDRIRALEDSGLLTSPPDDVLDRIARLASTVLKTPIGAVSLVEQDRQWFKAIEGLRVEETPRRDAFCAYTILDDEPVVTEDATRDPRFFDNKLVTGDLHVRAYAGVPLHFGSARQRIGALCVIDTVPREFQTADLAFLADLAAVASEFFRLRLLADQTGAAQKARSAFLSGISHELRTPLNSILGYSSLLESESLDSMTRSEAFGAIRRHGARLVGLIDEILDYCALESGAIRTTPATFEPERFISEIVGMLSPKALGRGLSIEFRWEGPAGRQLTCDTAYLRHIVNNLLTNAIEFSESGRVSASAWVSGDASGLMLNVSVTDHGPGINPGRLASLFEPGPPRAGEPEQTVSNLGLTVTRRLAELLGGGVRAESIPGTGSRFTAWVRVEEAARAVDRALGERSVSDRAASPGQALSGRRYLVAEDGPDNLRLLTLFLTRAGAQVESASNGIEALRTVHVAGANAFDAIIMDLGMPIMGGHEATRLLRSRGCKTPIVALTASDTADDRARCAAEGFDLFLAKPVNRDALISALRELPRRPG